MAYPSVGLNLNYKLLDRGTEERGGVGEAEGEETRDAEGRIEMAESGYGGPDGL